MKGQASIELVGIVGIALVLATPFVVEAQDSMIDLAISSEDANFQSEINELSETVDKVSASGEKSKQTVEFQLPPNIESVTSQQQALIFTQARGDQRKNFSTSFNTEINSTGIPADQGIYELEVEYRNGKAYIARAGASATGSLTTPANYRISSVSYPSEVEQGEQFNVTFDVTNTGGSQGSQDIVFSVNSGSGYSETKSNQVLGSGSSKQIEFNWDTSGESTGNYQFSVSTQNDSVTGQNFDIKTGLPSTGLVGHWDASNLDQAYSDGDTVSNWPEKVANNNATAPTTPEAPTLSVNGIKGNSALTFDGSDVLTVNHSSEYDLNDFTVVTLFKADSSSLTENIGTINNKQTADKFNDRNWWISLDNGNGFAGGNGALALRTSSSGSIVSLEASDKNYIDDEPYLSVALVNSTADQASFRVESVEKDAATGIGQPEGSGAPIGFGAEISGSVDSGFDRFFAGELGEILIYNRSLQPSEITDLETHLDDKWGLSTVIQEPNFRIASQSTNSPVIEGENLTVNYNVSNEGNNQDTQAVSLVVENQTGVKFSESRSHTLAAGSSTGSQTFEIQTAEGDSGLYNYTIQTENETVDSQLEITESFTTNGLHAHWDMANLSYSNGATVTSVSDSSGNGYDLTNSGTGPVMVENALNGNDLIEFQGNSRLDSPQWSAISEPYTVFMVTSSYDAPSDAVTMDTAGGGGRAFMARDNPEWRIWNGGGLNTGFAGDEQEHIITAVYSSSSAKFRYDGTENAGTTGSNSITSIRLGQDSGGSRALEGRMGEVMLYDRSLSQTEIDNVESYLSGKWGITLS